MGMECTKILYKKNVFFNLRTDNMSVIALINYTFIFYMLIFYILLFDVYN